MKKVLMWGTSTGHSTGRLLVVYWSSTDVPPLFSFVCFGCLLRLFASVVHFCSLLLPTDQSCTGRHVQAACDVDKVVPLQQPQQFQQFQQPQQHGTTRPVHVEQKRGVAIDHPAVLRAAGRGGGEGWEGGWGQGWEGGLSVLRPSVVGV